MSRHRSPAARRYVKRFVPAMIAYGLVLATSTSVIVTGRPKGALLWGLAVAPALPIIAVIVVLGLYLSEETDEFERMVLVQSMLWGTGLLLAGCTAWGFLENFGLVPHAPLYLIFPMFCAGWGLSQPLIRRRYR